MSNTYNSDARVMTLADALGQDPDLVGKVWSRQLREGASQVDDFAAFEGGERDQKPFVVKSDLNAKAGDEIRFTVMSDVAGPGVRGETELTGNTSSVDFHTYTCKVDFWRDAFEPTKKQLQFIAAGGSVKSEALKNLRNKLGRQRMYDMKMALKLLGKGNTVRPNGKRSKNELTAADTMSPGLLPVVKPQLQRLGGKPFMVSRNKHGSPVYSYMAYIPDVAMVDAVAGIPANVLSTSVGRRTGSARPASPSDHPVVPRTPRTITRSASYGEPHPITGSSPTPPPLHRFSAEGQALTHQQIQEGIAKIREEGHADDRHGSQVTEGQLDLRAMHKIDPMTQTREDGVKSGLDHKCSKHATQFTSDRALVQARLAVEASQDFRDQVALGRPIITVDTISLEAALGPNYLEHVRGKTRVGSAKHPTGTTNTDLKDGHLTAIYRKIGHDYELVTLFPNPKS